MEWAKGVLNALMDSKAKNVSRMYIYELLDEKPDPSNSQPEMHFGLFSNNNSPKVAAVALHNLTSILNKNQATPVNGAEGQTLGYSLSNVPVSANQLLLQKADGRFVLALWNETAFWNHTTGTSVTGSPANIVVNFGATATVVNLYDPMVSSAPIATYANQRTMTIAVPDHPVLVEVTLPR